MNIAAVIFKVGGMEKEPEDFFPSSVSVSLTRGHIFPGCDVF